MSPYSDDDRYADQGDRFGQLLLTLRSRIGRTQATVATYLGVSRRTVGSWETDNTTPSPEHLQQFIALALNERGFRPGHEADEIRTLWREARSKTPLDETWLTLLLAGLTANPSLHVAAPPVLITVPFSQSPAMPPRLPLVVPSAPPSPSTPVRTRARIQDWGDAPSIQAFYGRETELETLQKWVLDERSRVVCLLGLGGMGKSSLAVTFMRHIADQFEAVVWRSVRDAPDCRTLLDGCLQILAPQSPPNGMQSFEERLHLLLDQMRQRRVLLALDNVETLLVEGSQKGVLRSDYEEYGQLFRRIAETNHQSCLILTSREKPTDLMRLEGRRSSVQVLRLSQLDMAACDRLLGDKALSGTAAERNQLADTFTGNPLALKIVAQTINDLFSGEIGLFLAQGDAIFGGVRRLLDQQFDRLSLIEQTVLMWLAILRENVTFDDLTAVLVRPMPRMQLLETIEALYQRSLVERGKIRGSFSLQSVVLEYMTSRLVTEVGDELVGGNPVRLLEHGLVLASAREYVRQSQQRLIIRPLLDQFTRPYGDARLLEKYIRHMLEQVRTLPQARQGYGGGNLVSLLVAAGADVTGWDFSGLNIWQAYLAGIELHGVNLVGCDLRGSVFRESFSSISSVAYSPDGQFLAGACLDGDIKVWRLTQADGYALHLDCQGHQATAVTVAYSPDGTVFASGSFDRTVRLWSADTGQPVRVLEGHTDRVESIAFNPDGTLLASGSFDRTIRVWRVATGEAVALLDAHTNWVSAVAFSPDGKLVASGSFDGTILLWDTNRLADAATPVTTLGGYEGWVTRFVFSPDGQTLFSGGTDGTLRAWSVATAQQLYSTQSQHDIVQALAVSPDGLTLASGGGDPVIRLWQAGSDGLELKRTLSGHSAAIVSLAISPNGATIASSNADRSLRLWSLQTGEPLAIVQGYFDIIMSIAISPNGGYLVSSTGNNRVALWRLADDSANATVDRTPTRTLRDHTGDVLAVTLSSDGALLASAGRDAKIHLWDMRDSTHSQPRRTLTLSGHTHVILGLAFSPIHGLLASGSTDGTVRLWSTVTGKQLATLEGHRATVWTVAFSPDGRSLASGGNDGSVRLWQANSGQFVAALNTDGIPVMCVMYQPAGQFLACAKFDGTIEVWDATNVAKPHLILSGHQGTVWGLAFNPNPTLPAQMLSGGTDGSIRLWDIERGTEVARFAHGQHLRSIAFSPDGKSVFGAGAGGQIKQWDVDSRKILALYRDYLPYEAVNITGAVRLTAAQRATLRTLGAVEN